MPNEDDDGEARRALWARMPRKLAASSVIIRDECGRVLLVDPVYKPGWELPGGVVEAHESPRVAARRECLEELGLSIEVGALLAIDYQVAARERGDGYVFAFDGGVLTDARVQEIRLPPDELGAWRFVELDGVLALGGPSRDARVRAALSAARTGRLLELTDGKRSSTE